MKQITLNKLSLTDFKACSGVYEFKKTNTVYARNKGGKSRLHNAWLWLLTSSDNQNRTNFELFDTTKDVTKENSKPAIVEADITIDGVNVVLKRTAEQGWVKSRGETTYHRNGSDKYNYYVDDIEYSAKDYNKYIEDNIAPIEKIKIIANVTYFLSLDWKTQRQELLDIVGEIETSEYSQDYSDIVKLISNTGADNVKTDLRKKINILKDAVKSSDDKIKALQDVLPDISDVEEAKKKKQADLEEISKIDGEMAGNSESVKPYIEKRNKELSEIDLLKRTLSDNITAYDKKYNDKLESKKQEITNIVYENNRIDEKNKEKEDSIHEIEKKISFLKKDIETKSQYRLSLLDQRDKVKALMPTDTKCPYCGQELPTEKAEEAKQKFFESKKAKLDSIIASGKSNTALKKDLESQLEYYNKKLEEAKNYTPIEKKSIEILKKEYKDIQSLHVSYYETQEYADLNASIKEKEASLTVIPQVDNEAYKEKKKALLDDIQMQLEVINKEKLKKDYLDKISKEQEVSRLNGVEQADKERMLQRIDDYLSEQADIISKRANKNFKRCHVEMLTVNKSGSQVPCCDIITDGRKSQVFNTAENTLTGIDIAQAFSSFYDVSIPLFIDNIEGLSKESRELINVNAQVIFLCVSNDDKIKIESED